MGSLLLALGCRSAVAATTVTKSTPPSYVSSSSSSSRKHMHCVSTFVNKRSIVKLGLEVSHSRNPLTFKNGHDRKTLLSILSVLYTPNILDDDYKFSASGIYYAPSDCQYADYIEFIKELPAITKPEAFGLHENADITKDHKEANELLSAIEATQSIVGGAGGKSKEEVVLELSVEFATKLLFRSATWQMALLYYPY